MRTGDNASDHRVWKSWYSSKRWRKLRKEILAKEKYCQSPHCKGKAVPATVVDHITPHKGDTRLFWKRDNLQPLCKLCHDKFKQSEEKGGKGFNQGCDIHGNPLNPPDHWQ